MNKLILAGGTGFIGKALVSYLKNQFTEVVILTRSNYSNHENVRAVKWDGHSLGAWVNELENADVLINLSGRNINCRFTESNKKEILESRINSTHVLGNAISQLKVTPKLWINFSATAIYASSFVEPQDEFSTKAGRGFMYEVCKQWEAAFKSYQFASTRMVTLRVAMVMGENGGVYTSLLPLVKSGLGGAAGSGKQLVSWIHIHDLCRLVDWLIGNKNARGIYNASSPNPVTNSVFMQSFRKSKDIAIGLPAPTLFVKAGAFLMGTEASLVLDSVHVVPTKSISEGFKFQYETMDACLQALVQ